MEEKETKERARDDDCKMAKEREKCKCIDSFIGEAILLSENDQKSV